MVKLEGKTAIVTGAGRKGGLGQAIARRFAEEGCRVLITDLGQPSGPHLSADNIGSTDELDQIAEELRTVGPAVETIACDVRLEEDVKNAVAQAVNSWGRLDIVVNNAAVGYIMKPVMEFTSEEWDLVQAVNLKGPFLFTKHGSTQMIAQGNGGRIVNIASQAAKSGFAEASAYASSKHGLLGLTRSAAIDLGRYGITVNAVCPNHVTTGLGAKQNAFRSQVRGMTVDDLLKDRAAKVPLGRVGLPADTANACVFLASEDAGYITGEGLNVSGGEEMH